jgi:hypothetical protein
MPIWWCVFSFYSSFVGLIFSETLHSMLLTYILYDKGKLLTIVDPSARHFAAHSMQIPKSGKYNEKKYIVGLYISRML